MMIFKMAQQSIQLRAGTPGQDRYGLGRNVTGATASIKYTLLSDILVFNFFLGAVKSPCAGAIIQIKTTYETNRKT
jgi:hypothetical protein